MERRCVKTWAFAEKIIEGFEVIEEGKDRSEPAIKWMKFPP